MLDFLTIFLFSFLLTLQGPLADAEQGVHRDCFDCGRTCQSCRDTSLRRCQSPGCNSEYCVMHAEGSTETRVSSPLLHTPIPDPTSFINSDLLHSATGAVTEAVDGLASSTEQKRKIYTLDIPHRDFI